MRNLYDVIEQMIALVPGNEEEFLEGIRAVQSSAAFSAPEMIGLHWRRAAALIQERFEDPDNPNQPLFTAPWQEQVVDLFTDKQHA